MTKQLVVGVDPHRKKNVVQVMDSQGQILDRPFGVANNRPGTEGFIKQIVAHAQVEEVAGILPEGAETAVHRKTYVENLKFASAEMGKAGIRCLMEMINTRDIPGFYLNTSAQAEDVLAEVGSDNLCLQYDIYHMQIMEGDLARNIELLHGLADREQRTGVAHVELPVLEQRFDLVAEFLQPQEVADRRARTTHGFRRLLPPY